MNKVKLTVGGEIENEASQRFVDAWHRGERGEALKERHLAFESWDALARVLTGKRMELLHYVRRNNVTSHLMAEDDRQRIGAVYGQDDWRAIARGKTGRLYPVAGAPSKAVPRFISPIPWLGDQRLPAAPEPVM